MQGNTIFLEGLIEETNVYLTIFDVIKPTRKLLSI